MDLFPCSKNINSNKKGDCSNFSSYHPTILLLYFLVFLKLLKLSLTNGFSSIYLFNLLSDRQYGLSEECTTGDLLASSWSSSLSYFNETFAVALDISKAFDRAWHK